MGRDNRGRQEAEEQQRQRDKEAELREMATPTAEMDGLRLQEKEEPGWDARTEQGSGRAKESYHQYTSEGARDEDDRETALRAELKSVRDINAVIEGVVESLERAKGNMEVRTF